MTLPLVLAGPIVRRVEPRSVSIWLALSEPAPVTVLVWPNHQKATSTPGVVRTGDTPWATATATPVAVGANLHVALVTVTTTAPDPPLMPGAIHAYDIHVAASSGPADLRSLGFLQDESGDADVDDRPPRLALGYGEDKLPSFATAPVAAEDLVLAHASCRNTLGTGHDAMAYLDEVIEASVGVATKRPHQLFLTGDQIYADDVSMLVLRNLNVLGEELFGRHETLPVDIPGVGLTNVSADLVEFPPERRTRLLRRVARFTSGSSANHLLSFAEYCAMYLSAWSPSTWSTLPTADDIYTENRSSVGDLLTPHELCAIDRLNREGMLTDDLANDPVGVWKRQKSGADDRRFERQRERTQQYRAAVPQAQRALANVATYMIFDDHEVTDDWNLTQQWTNRANTSPLGRTVLRNALMAYTLFQGWGNDPAQFASGDGKRLLEGISTVMTGNGPGPAVDPATEVDRLLGLSGSAPKVTWNYHVDGAVHRVVVLDTRTRRGFPGRVSPPDLLGDTLNEQVPKGPLGGGLETLVVVSAVPVLGPLLIDGIGQPVRILVEDFSTHVWRRLFAADDDPCAEEHPLGLEEFDAESWARNDDALEALLARLATHERVLLLSGDVHYAMSLVLDYWKKGATDRATSRIVQLTASPARNHFKPLVEGLLRSAAVAQRLEAVGLPAVRLAWMDAAEDNLALPSGSSVRPGTRARMNHDPVLVPADGWPAGTTLAAPPDWRWRLDLLRDPRTDAQRPRALDPPATLDPDVDRDVDGYLRLAGRHAIAGHQHFDHLRQVVFPNNVGLVRFPLDEDGTPLVRHEIVSEDPEDPRHTTSDGPPTVHQVVFAPPEDAPPGLVTVSGGDDDG